jgi:hypothetical protein
MIALGVTQDLEEKIRDQREPLGAVLSGSNAYFVFLPAFSFLIPLSVSYRP